MAHPGNREKREDGHCGWSTGVERCVTKMGRKAGPDPGSPRVMSKSLVFVLRVM